ncbi:type VI secretion system protein TssA [Paludisphaera mucosa]|uniref:Type VI secretion system protein TssA n=1 Tax=Paludisphaera mucosa TaxID=3030827 RepID=A0ABT6FDX4_9BACT|nr:type VI secretion system protein TssA [Paludisphaera mucosa]MDG3005776.1 type VI secretion system protein TssA [Paludisphaera mucosa]
MSEPAVLDVDELVEPISESDAVGEYLRWEDEYADLEEARRADEDAGADGVWSRDKKTSDWRAILSLGSRLLRERSKDLQIAAWVAEACSHQHGLVGVRDGLRLVLALQERYWDELHPERGDLELREGVYEFIDHDRVLPLLVRGVPVTYVPSAPDYTYTFLDYEASRKTEILANSKFENEEHRADALEGRLTGERFEEAVHATERSFYETYLATCEECLAVVEQINQGIAGRWKGPNRPRLSKLETALLGCKKLARQILARKPDDRPPPEPETEPEAVDDGWGDSESHDAEVSQYGWSESESEVEAPKPSRRPARRRAAGAPSTPEDARDQIAEAAHFLRGQDPADPTPYLVVRALALGGLYQPDGLDPSRLPPPSSEVREKLFLASREGDEDSWKAMLDEAEQALGRPEGRGWLDLHTYASTALAGLGLEDPLRACKSLLKACLKDHEGWVEAPLRDGTPCASPATRSWLTETGLIGEPASEPVVDLSRIGPAYVEPAAEDDGASASRPAAAVDAWDVAQDHLRNGEVAEALAVMARASRQAESGRERFLRALQQAELCLALNRDALALPILENLAARIDDQKLDQWEGAGLCARVFSSLYRCLRGRDEARAAIIHHRLCQLDIGLAIRLENM